MPELLHATLTYKIRGVILEVAKQYGKGFKEAIYQKALAEEFTSANITFEAQKQITIYSLKSGKILGYYIPDLIVEDKIIIELKASEFTSKQYYEQQLSYLKASKYEVGLLVNFNSSPLLIKRFIFTNDRKPNFQVFRP